MSTQETTCPVCHGVGMTYVGGKYVRCKHCGGKHVAEPMKVVGYARMHAIKKKEKREEEIVRAWK